MPGHRPQRQKGSDLMKIFVTGGAGFIGSNFIRHLLGLGQGYAVVNYDKLTYAGNLANLESVVGDAQYSFIRGDICDPAPVIETNVTGTFVMLQIARKLDIQRFVHISTDEVYGDILPGTFSDEGFALRPSSPYSASKASSDLLVRSYVRTYGFPGLITRSSNNYGPFQFPEKFLPLMITNALDDKPLPIYGDGKQQRDWLHVEDNCRGILAVLLNGRIGEVYNIGGMDIEENLDMARRLLRLTGKPESLLTYVKDRPGHDRRYALSCQKMKEHLGWTPKIALNQGIRQTIDWYKSSTKWLAGVRDGDYRTYYQKYYENRESTLQDFAPKTS